MSTAVSAFSTDLTGNDVRLTARARDQLSRLLAQVDDDEIQAVRVFVTGGGCGGMTYGMTFTDSATEFDCIIEEDGFALYIDTVALNFMRGVEIDFVERPTGASFVFNNAFAATSTGGACGGCGSAGGGGCA